MPIDRSGPRLHDLERGARSVGRLIKEQLEHEARKPVGFALYVFEFGAGGFLTYVANAPREDMRRVMAEWLEREGGVTHHEDCPHAQQCTCSK